MLEIPIRKFLVRFVFGTVIFLFVLAGGVEATDEDEQLKAFKELLNTIEMDPCTGLMSNTLTAEERTKMEMAANEKCKKYHELLKNSPFYESEDCYKGDDPRCALTVDSWDKMCYKMNRCSLSIDGTWCGTKRRSIYRCVSNALQLHKDRQAKECASRRQAKGYKPAPEPPAPTRNTAAFPTARAPTATVNTRAPTSMTASNSRAPPRAVPAPAAPTKTVPAPAAPTKTVPAPAAPTIKRRARTAPAQPAPTNQTPATTAPPAKAPNWPTQRQDSIGSWEAHLPPPTQWSITGSPRFGSAGNTPIGLIGGPHIPPPRTSPGVTVTIDPRASGARTVNFSKDVTRGGGGYQRSKTFS